MLHSGQRAQPESLSLADGSEYCCRPASIGGRTFLRHALETHCQESYLPRLRGRKHHCMLPAGADRSDHEPISSLLAGRWWGQLRAIFLLAQPRLVLTNRRTIFYQLFKPQNHQIAARSRTATRAPQGSPAPQGNSRAQACPPSPCRGEDRGTRSHRGNCPAYGETSLSAGVIPAGYRPGRAPHAPPPVWDRLCRAAHCA